jgi:hypothetical protein
MLPAFRRITISAATALAIALPSAPAHAFDAREQGVITGVLGTLLITGLIAQNNKHRQPAYQPPAYPQPVIQPPSHTKPAYQPQTSVYRTPAANAFSSYGRSERRLIQSRLSRLGYYYGSIDGSFGPGTYNAVLAYARDNGGSVNSRNESFSVYDSLIF